MPQLAPTLNPGVRWQSVSRWLDAAILSLLGGYLAASRPQTGRRGRAGQGAASLVAPGAAFLIPPPAVAEVAHQASIRPAAAFATSLRPLEADQIDSGGIVGLNIHGMMLGLDVYARPLPYRPSELDAPTLVLHELTGVIEAVEGLASCGWPDRHQHGLNARDDRSAEGDDMRRGWVGWMGDAHSLHYV